MTNLSFLGFLPGRNSLGAAGATGKPTLSRAAPNFHSQGIDARTVPQFKILTHIHTPWNKSYAVSANHITALGIHVPAFPYPAEVETHRGING